MNNTTLKTMYPNIYIPNLFKQKYNSICFNESYQNICCYRLYRRMLIQIIEHQTKTFGICFFKNTETYLRNTEYTNSKICMGVKICINLLIAN